MEDRIVAIEFPQGDDDPITEYFGPFSDAEEADAWIILIQTLTPDSQWRFHNTTLDSPWNLAGRLLETRSHHLNTP